jgi:hypothetical protein
VRKSAGKRSVEFREMYAGENGSYTWNVMEMVQERANTAGACNNLIKF